MVESKEDIQVCETCGASVYPEHIESGKAATVDGKLRCPLCLEEYKKSHHSDEERYVGTVTTKAPGEDMEAEPIALADDEKKSSSTTHIKAFGGGESVAGAVAIDDSQYQRPMIKDQSLATRCRTFHSRLSDGAVVYMNRQINEWADANPEVTIKFATSTIGIWEGKKADATLIITVFY